MSTRVPVRPAASVTAPVLLVAAGCALAVRDLPVQLPDSALAWPVLLVLYVLADAWVVELRIRRESRLLTPSDVALVLGLFLVQPLALLAVRAAAHLLVLRALRPQPPVKLVVNICVGLVETAVAVAVFRVVAGASGPLEPRGAAAVLLALVCGGAVSTLAVTTVIGLSSGGVRRADLLDGLRLVVPIAAVTGTLGLVAVSGLSLDVRTAWVLGPAAAIGLLGLHQYARLAERHRDLRRLHRAGLAVAAARDVDDVVRSVLEQARELLGVRLASLVLLPASGAASGLRLSYDGRQLVPHDAPEVGEGGWLRREIDGGCGRLVDGADDPDAARELAGQGVGALLVAPMSGAGGLFGAVVVGDRFGSVERFYPADVPLLEQVAEQAAVALEHGRTLEQLRHEARHDALTGLANRASFEATLALQLEQVRTGRSTGTALLLTDLDGFKRVNDTHGHHWGDVLLREVGRRLLASAPEGAVVARLGGDEFAVVLPGVDDVERARTTAQALLAALAEPVEAEVGQLVVRASTGVALAPLHGTDRGPLLRAADRAMYAAKAAGTGVAVHPGP